MSTAFPFYLARTAAEFSLDAPISAASAWMACHFSSYGTGLSNLPSYLPEGSMLILNDRIPVCGHDPKVIYGQLRELAERLRPGCILLDFQRPGEPETARIAASLADFPLCPVGVSECYAEKLCCPVFLPPPPLDCPPERHLAPWQGREIWLEAALGTTVLTVTEAGCHREDMPFSQAPEDCFREARLHCRYRITLTDDAAVFHLYRTREDLQALLSACGELGVTRSVGLFQELGSFALQAF